MALRETAEINAQTVDLAVIIDDARADTSGVQHARVLLDFAQEIVAGKSDALTRARLAVIGALSMDAMVTAAGVASNFQRMVRIADGTGIPVDAPMLVLTESIRDELGINTYTAAANTPELGTIKRLFFKLFGAVMFRRMLRRASREQP